jgi:hypothetical protein
MIIPIAYGKKLSQRKVKSLSKVILDKKKKKKQSDPGSKWEMFTIPSLLLSLSLCTGVPSAQKTPLSPSVPHLPLLANSCFLI